MSSKEKHGKKFSCLPSCFSISPVLLPDSGDDIDKPTSPKELQQHNNKTSFFTRFRMSNKTSVLPVLVLEKEHSVDIKDIKDMMNTLPPYNHKHNFISKFFKRKLDRDQKKSNKLNSSIKSNKSVVSTKSDENVNPKMPLQSNSLTSSSNRVQTKCTNSPEPSLIHVICSDKPKTPVEPNKRFDREVQFFIPVLTLTLIIFLGKAIAIAFLCFSFYSISLLRPSEDDVKKVIREEIDFDSSEYKKKIIIEGLLDRSDKKSSKLRR